VYSILHTVKLSSGKTFAVRVQNGHLQENFHSCMLVLHIDIADRQGYMIPTCWHFCMAAGLQHIAQLIPSKWVLPQFRYGEHLPSVWGIVLI